MTHLENQCTENFHLFTCGILQRQGAERQYRSDSSTNNANSELFKTEFGVFYGRRRILTSDAAVQANITLDPINPGTRLMLVLVSTYNNQLQAIAISSLLNKKKGMYEVRLLRQLKLMKVSQATS